MKKLSIFVEGQTEAIFVEKLLYEIANKNEIVITTEKIISGNGNTAITDNDTQNKLIMIQAEKGKKKYYVQIINCQADNKVQSAMRARHEGLMKAGFSKILGLKDLYPHTYSELPKFEKYSTTTIDNVTAHTIIALMEVETWFIKECNHFNNIHPDLTLNSILALGYDLKNDCLESDPKYRCSADVLHQIYSSVNLAYKKKEKQCIRTVNALDYENLYINTVSKLSSLKKFVDEINDFLA